MPLWHVRQIRGMSFVIFYYSLTFVFVKLFLLLSCFNCLERNTFMAAGRRNLLESSTHVISASRCLFISPIIRRTFNVSFTSSYCRMIQKLFVYRVIIIS